MAVTAVAGVGARPVPRLRRLEDERTSVCGANHGFRQGRTLSMCTDLDHREGNYVILRMLSVRSPT